MCICVINTMNFPNFQLHYFQECKNRERKKTKKKNHIKNSKVVLYLTRE